MDENLKAKMSAAEERRQKLITETKEKAAISGTKFTCLVSKLVQKWKYWHLKSYSLSCTRASHGTPDRAWRTGSWRVEGIKSPNILFPSSF